MSRACTCFFYNFLKGRCAGGCADSSRLLPRSQSPEVTIVVLQSAISVPFRVSRLPYPLVTIIWRDSLRTLAAERFSSPEERVLHPHAGLLISPPPPSVDKLAVKLQDGTFASRPLALLARSRAATYRGELVAVRDEEFSPARFAAFTEASTHAAAAASADPASPLLALHAILACYDAIQSGAYDEYCRALSSYGAGNEKVLEALIPLNRLANRMMALLINTRGLTARLQTAEGGDGAGDGVKEKEKGGGGGAFSAGGRKEAAAPSAAPSAGSAQGLEGGGGGGGATLGGPGAPAEAQPSDPLFEVSDRARLIPLQRMAGCLPAPTPWATSTLP